MQEFPTTESPLVADMSSDILCRPIDVKSSA
jgi:phosphoserine aminotransferase